MFKPNVSNQNDTSNIDKNFTREVAAETPLDRSSEILAEAEDFENFSYKGNGTSTDFDNF